jgi:hypothetical protein
LRVESAKVVELRRQRKTLRQGVARPDLLTHTLEVEISGKKIGDLTGAEVANGSRFKLVKARGVGAAAGSKPKA